MSRRDSNSDDSDPVFLLRCEVFRVQRQLAELFQQLRAHGVEDPSSSARWQLLNFLEISPGSHSASALAEVIDIPPRSAGALLAALAVDGLIERVGQAHFRAAKKAKRPRARKARSESLVTKIERTIVETRTPLSSREVLVRLGLGARESELVQRTLAELARDGRIACLRTGIYAAKPKAPRVTLIRRIERAVLDSPKALSASEVCAALEAPHRLRSVRTLLGKLAKQEHIRSDGKGMYWPLETADNPMLRALPAQERAAPSVTLEQALHGALKAHPGGVPFETIAATLDGDDEEIGKALRALLAEKRVRRIRHGVYVAIG